MESGYGSYLNCGIIAFALVGNCLRCQNLGWRVDNGFVLLSIMYLAGTAPSRHQRLGIVCLHLTHTTHLDIAHKGIIGWLRLHQNNKRRHLPWKTRSHMEEKAVINRSLTFRE